MKKLVLIGLLNFCCQVGFADPLGYCVSNLLEHDDLLSLSQIKALCASQVDNGFMDFAVTISTLEVGPSCKRGIVFLGETHIKSNSLGERGEAVLKQFNVRGYEGVPSTDFQKLKGSKGFDGLSGFYRFWQGLEFLGLARFSSIHDAVKRGLDVADPPSYYGVKMEFEKSASSPWVGLLNVFSKGSPESLSQSISSDSMLKYRNYSSEELKRSLLSHSEEFARVFGKALETDPNFIVNFWLEYGDLDSYNYNCDDLNGECDRFILDERNKRFARNIMSIANELPCNTPLLVIIGKGHLFGLTRLLNDNGYKSIDTLGKFVEDRY